MKKAKKKSPKKQKPKVETKHDFGCKYTPDVTAADLEAMRLKLVDLQKQFADLQDRHVKLVESVSKLREGIDFLKEAFGQERRRAGV
jgi:tryptophan 2,3-dioxygenase